MGVELLPSSGLIDAVYGAALDAARWPAAMARLAEAFGGVQATLYSHDTRQHRADIHAEAGIEPAFLRSYVDHFGARNPFVSGVAQLQPGAFATADDLVARDVYRGGEFYADWVRPQGCEEFITTNLHCGAGNLSGVTVLRGRRAFGQGEKARWAALMPHLRRAMQVHRELHTARLARDGALEALHRLSIGVVLAGAGAEVLFANAAAERAFGPTRGLQVRGGRLCGQTSAASDALCHAVDAAIATATGRGAQAGDVLALPGRAGLPVPVLVSPLPVSDPPPGLAGTVALVLIGGERRLRAARGDLMRAFGLTPAEANLLSALVGGRSLAGHAADNAIALETVRAHLRKVLVKTGANRQTDAIRRVLADPVLGRPDFASVDHGRDRFGETDGA